ncbi:hypothetical protein MTO96_045973, partial [Rhipicephalus appendiculatus]
SIEAGVFDENKNEDASGQTKEALVVGVTDNEYAQVCPATECGLTLGDDEDTHPRLSYSVALVSGTTPECIGGKPSTRDDKDQESAPRKRKRLQHSSPARCPWKRTRRALRCPRPPSLHLISCRLFLAERDPWT